MSPHNPPNPMLFSLSVTLGGLIASAYVTSPAQLTTQYSCVIRQCSCDQALQQLLKLYADVNFYQVYFSCSSDTFLHETLCTVITWRLCMHTSQCKRPHEHVGNVRSVKSICIIKSACTIAYMMYSSSAVLCSLPAAQVIQNSCSAKHSSARQVPGWSQKLTFLLVPGLPLGFACKCSCTV